MTKRNLENEIEKVGDKNNSPEQDIKRLHTNLPPQYNFIKFCYRHDPDIQTSSRSLQNYQLGSQQFNLAVEMLPKNEYDLVNNMIATFSGSNDKLRKLILEGFLEKCCFPQLSFIASKVLKLIKIDFISALPEELALKILSYLDCKSLCQCSKVSRRWKQLSDDDRVWYIMCKQHIDKKCPNCGWGLPLLHMKRARFIEAKNIVNTSSDIGIEYKRARPWKVIYQERFKIESNWRRGKYRSQEFCGHMDGVLSLKFTHSLLFTGSYDSTVAIWDISSGKLIKRLIGHEGGVKTLSLDNQKLITGSLDKTIRVWNYITGACISTYRGHQDSILSVDCHNKIIASGSADKTIKIWHIDTRTCYTLHGHKGWVNCVKLHPKSFTCFSGSDDTTIRMWDIRTNLCVKVLKGHAGQVQKVIPMTLVDMDNLITDPEQQLQHTDSNNFDPEITGMMDNTLDYPTHILSCSLDNTIKLWDLKTENCIRTYFGHLEGVWDISADNFRIVSGSHDKSIKIWDLQNGKCIHTILGNDAPISCVSIGDSEFVSGDESGTVKVYRFD